MIYSLVILLLVSVTIMRRSLSYTITRLKFPTVGPKNTSRVLLHAVSLGEAQVGVTLARRLQHMYPHLQIYMSCITHAAIEYLRQQEGIHSFFLPFDFRNIMKRFIETYQFDGILFVETDFWFNLMQEAAKKKIFVGVFNGKISHTSATRFRWVPFFSRRLFQKIECCCVQNEEYRQRFSHFIKPDKIHVCGNIKLDAPYTPDSSFKHKLRLQKHEYVITFGSTHAPEERLILEAIRPLLHYPIRVLFVPRHAYRFDAVYHELKQSALPVGRFSEQAPTQLMVIDSLGVLNHCYACSDIACVCGSFTQKVGGHNILEPCRFGVPVLFGPYMYKQTEFVHLAHQYGIGEQIPLHRLRETLEQWIANPTLRRTYGEAGKKLFSQEGGAIEKTVHCLHPLLQRIQKTCQGV